MRPFYHVDTQLSTGELPPSTASTAPPKQEVAKQTLTKVAEMMNLSGRLQYSHGIIQLWLRGHT